MVIKNFYEKKIFNPFYESDQREAFFTLGGLEKKSISSQELFGKILLLREVWRNFSIQRGCNCTSTMVVPKERTKRGWTEEGRKKGKDDIDRMKPGILRYGGRNLDEALSDGIESLRVPLGFSSKRLFFICEMSTTQLTSGLFKCQAFRNVSSRERILDRRDAETLTKLVGKEIEENIRRIENYYSLPFISIIIISNLFKISKRVKRKEGERRGIF